MAEFAISEAKRMTTVPLTDGLIMPVSSAILPLTNEVRLDAAGLLYVEA